MPKQVRQIQTSDSLKRHAERMTTAASQLHALAANMDQESITEIEPTHYVALTRGLKAIEDFAHAAKQAYFDALEQRDSDRGDRQDDDQESAKPPNKRRKKGEK